MKRIKLGVIFGGQSTEHDVSIVSGTSVIKNLSKEKYDILPMYIDKNGEWYEYKKDILKINTMQIGKQPIEIEKIENVMNILKTLDVIFPVLHGLYGEDGTVQGLFELLKIPYVGCRVLSSSICMNKIYAKMIFEKAGINQAKSITINKEKRGYIYIDERLNRYLKTEKELCKIVESKLKYPVFIKPSNSGSSVGVNKANNNKEFIEFLKEAEKYDKEILVEENIVGKEVECAVLGTEDVSASTVGQILSAEEFYDYEAKYENEESRTVIPADIDKNILEDIKQIAVKAFKAVNGNGLSRVDFFVQEDTNKIYLNEINTLPGFTNISMYPKLWESTGIKYSELLDKLIEQEIS